MAIYNKVSKSKPVVLASMFSSGAFPQDFTFLEEQPNYRSGGRINYDKMQVVGGFLREINLFQNQVCPHSSPPPQSCVVLI